jgi:hypothetical protein
MLSVFGKTGATNVTTTVAPVKHLERPAREHILTSQCGWVTLEACGTLMG